jgi:hypothetical protein
MVEMAASVEAMAVSVAVEMLEVRRREQRRPLEQRVARRVLLRQQQVRQPREEQLRAQQEETALVGTLPVVTAVAVVVVLPCRSDLLQRPVNTPLR